MNKYFIYNVRLYFILFYKSPQARCLFLGYVSPGAFLAASASFHYASA